MSQGSATIVPQISISNVSKSYGGVQALKDVSFDILPGVIHALLGENGAGKSTLVKILSGSEHADAGTTAIRGQNVRLRSPIDARRLGVSVVHQELSLFPDLTVRANIFAGREITGPLGAVNRRQMDLETRQVMEEVGWHIGADRRVGSLTLGERQMVEILRAIHQRADLIILDEPNSALTDRETQALFATVERMRALGHSFLLVSHRLDEVFAIAQFVTVLRDGHHVATLPRGKLEMQDAIVMMVGQQGVVAGTERREEPSNASKPPTLQVTDLTGETFAGISFEARPGEILGFAGLEGSGLYEMLAISFGLRSRLAGRIVLNGKLFAPRNPREAIGLGVASIPADRKEEGLVMDRSVAQNTVLVVLSRIASRLGIINNRHIELLAKQHLATLRVRAPSISAPVTQLSGGNQQKVVLAKWLAASPTILILNDPTRGVDVGAKREVHTTIRKMAETGITVLMWSSDASETLELCDRILIMRNGALAMECDPPRTTLNELLLAIAGEEDKANQPHRLYEEEEHARANLMGN